jgi:hypothetical protein
LETRVSSRRTGGAPDQGQQGVIAGSPNLFTGASRRGPSVGASEALAIAVQTGYRGSGRAFQAAMLEAR